MKIVNEPIKVMAIFHPNGEIEPIKFKYEGIEVRIEQINNIYAKKYLGNEYIMFICQHKGQFLYEIKYDVKTKIWYMFKK